MGEINLDVGTFLSVIGGAGTAWLAIRSDIAGLRRDVDTLMKKVFT